MNRSSSLYAALILTALLAGLHFLAGAYYLYWTFWWYDVMMHFLAGVTLGFFAFWILFRSGIIFGEEKRASLIILSVLLPVFLLGVAWEVFEYTNGITDSHEGYRLDTMNDLILDSCGAVFAALIAGRKKRHG